MRKPRLQYLAPQIRITSWRYVNRTLRTAPPHLPRQTYLFSASVLCVRSSAITRLASSNAYCASEKLTPCLTRFAKSFADSHSNLAFGIWEDYPTYGLFAI